MSIDEEDGVVTSRDISERGIITVCWEHVLPLCERSEATQCVCADGYHIRSFTV